MRQPYYGWVLVVALGVTTVVSYGTTAYAFGVLVVPIGQEMGWSRGELSGAFALSQVLAGLAGIPIGRRVDRYGARRLMAAGSLLGGLALIALARVQALWQLYLLWGGAIGLSMALTFYSVSMAIVANWFHRRRGAALALLTLLGGFASVLFVPLAGWLIPRLGWRDTVVILGLFQLLVALPLHALLLRRHPEDLGLRPDGDPPPPGPSLTDRAVASPTSARNPGEPEVGPPRGAVPRPTLPGMLLSQALREPAFWILTLAASLDQLAVMVVWAHAIAFMIDRGFDPVLAASMGGLVGLVSLPGRFVLNVLSDRLGPKRLLGVCLGVQALGLAFLIVGTSVAWLYAYALVYGVAYGTRSPLRASVMADYFGRRAYGAITAVQGLPIALASGLGPLAAGWLYDLLGDYLLAFWLTAAAYLLSGLIVLVSPRPRVMLVPHTPAA
jgi:MFS family permease